MKNINYVQKKTKKTNQSQLLQLFDIDSRINGL